VAGLPGVARVGLNFGAAILTVEGAVDSATVIREARRHDGVVARPDGQPPAQDARRWGWREARTLVSGGALVLGWLLAWTPAPPLLATGLFVGATLIGGYATIRQGLRALGRFTFDMNGMMTGALIGAACLGEWEEGASVAFLYAVSNWLEGSTLERARRSLRSLMSLAPPEARVRRGDAEGIVPIAELRVGDVLLVRPGEKLAADGTVRAGASAVDQAAITGESLPAEKGPGDPVFAGTLNGQGALEIEVTRRAQDTTLARIIHLVEEAQASRAPAQQFVDRFARLYTPAVFAAALAVMLLPPLLLGLSWSAWIYRGLALLIVSCPCALVVSTPVTIVSAISAAARHGVLIKGGAHLEELGRLQAVAFDKTGTLTQGRPELADVVPLNGRSAEALLAIAAAVETHSAHPLAGAIVEAARRLGVAVGMARDFTAIPGKGGHASLDGERIYVGSPRLFTELCIDGWHGDLVSRLEADGKTVMLVGSATAALGILALADPLRPSACRAIADLRAAGIRHVALLTGDNRHTAERIAATVGADAVRAEILPEEKLEAVRALRAAYGSLAMVGDGVNDAPALAAASVGIAMGAAGSDVALETADVALMSDDLSRLAYLIHLGRQTVRVTRQNIAFALLIKAVAILAVFPGWLTLWLAVLGDMGASVLVTLNGMRLLAVRPAPHTHHDACLGPGGCQDETLT
jgi:Zn2+/Cd2+-exporting ATPase